MFKKILIANRGEIACRITQTAHRLGCKVVAVYSDADAKARHVSMADEAVYIGGSQPSESYLCVDKIIAAAIAHGAEAVHPGYGFLSENPDFVEAVEAAGLAFVGPSASAIRAMGLKDAAKVLMEAAGVPVVPGYHGTDQDPERLAKEASSIGYPVLIKAVAGGGGKGMRRVDCAAEFSAALASAQAEARTAFGNADVLIEKYILQPRHIEMQVFGDGTQALHLYERDCSLQRRHQKVIEEAPAPGMTDAVRLAMGEAAVRAAEAIGYCGAGTVEFIVDGAHGLRPDGFWFMEMNTRLQVEHPVTEAITGIDLVEWQLRVASGAALPLTQSDISINGHAFEARLYAEDVPKGFLPATGTLDHLKFDPEARNDTGVRAGDTISPFYDPMIAKVITHGATRKEALAKLSKALKNTQVAGAVTNLGFLSALCEHSGFEQADMDTGLIERDLDQLVLPQQITLASIAAALLCATSLARSAVTGFHLWSQLWQSIDLWSEDEAIAVSYSYGADYLDIECSHGGITASESRITFAHGKAWLNDCVLPFAVLHGKRITVFGTPSLEFRLADPLDRAGSATGDANVILSPMPGLIRTVFVAKGQEVKEGDPVVTLEAMKMEHTLRAPKDGTVEDVYCADGDQVDSGQTLASFVDG